LQLRIFTPLRHRPIAKLWGGQLLSGLGDEINRVATIWLAAQTWGSSAGRLLAVYALAACITSLAGGVVADRVGHRRLLVTADLARAAAVLVIPLGAALHVPLAQLLVLSIAASGAFTALFEPALRALTLGLVPAPSLRGATNALMESTLRFARVLGPGLVALLATLVPTLHFFTVDAVTFAFSALSIVWIGRAATHGEGDDARATPQTGSSSIGIVDTLREIGRDPLLRYAIGSGALVGAAWWLLLPLGMELLLREHGAHQVSALAAVLLAYGIGNLAGNLVVGNFADRRPDHLLFFGRVLAGTGFMLFAMAPTRAVLLASAALAASGGPVTDVGFAGMVQNRYEGHALARVYRANQAVMWAAIFALFFASPALFRLAGIVPVFVACALTIGVGGVWGFARFRATVPTVREALPTLR
jgi:MFS family permease